MSQIKYSNLLEKEEIATSTRSIQKTVTSDTLYQKFPLQKQRDKMNSLGTLNNKINLVAQPRELEFSEVSSLKSKRITHNSTEIAENDLKELLKNSDVDFCTSSCDEQDCLNHRGVYHIPIQHEMLFSEEIEIETEELPRWQPRINIERRMIEDEDD